MVQPKGSDFDDAAGAVGRDSFSFAGCGFLGIYHMGVLSCLDTHIPQRLQSARFAGASAGALISCCFVSKVSMDQIVDHALRLIHKVQQQTLGAFDPELVVDSVLRETLEELLPQDAHELCSGRLFVSVTKLKGVKAVRRNEIISHFASREDLIQAILLSSFIPFVSDSKIPVLNGEPTIDGGFSDNLPRLDERTVPVSPLAGESGIGPRDITPQSGTFTVSNFAVSKSSANGALVLRSLFPPLGRQTTDLFWKGYDDALAYLTGHGMLRCHGQRKSSRQEQQCLKHNSCDCIVRLTSDPAASYAHTPHLHSIRQIFRQYEQSCQNMTRIEPLPASHEARRVFSRFINFAKSTATETPQREISWTTSTRDVFLEMKSFGFHPAKILHMVLLRAVPLSVMKTVELCPKVHFVHVDCVKDGNSDECPKTFWKIRQNCYRPNDPKIRGGSSFFECFYDPLPRHEKCKHILWISCNGFSNHFRSRDWSEIKAEPGCTGDNCQG